MKQEPTVKLSKQYTKISGYKLVIVLFLLHSSFQFSQAKIFWADNVVEFSSEYQTERTTQQYKATQAIGSPNVIPNKINHPGAWCPSTPNNPFGEYLHVSFNNPHQGNFIYIHESFNGGSVYRVDVFDEKGKDRTVYRELFADLNPNKGGILKIPIAIEKAKTVKSIKIYLACHRSPGWNHIDAIGISTEDLSEEKVLKFPYLQIDNSFVLNKLPTIINTEKNEFAPLIASVNDELLFVRRGADQTDNIFYAKQIDGQFRLVNKFESPINTAYNNFICGYSANKQTLFLGNVYKEQGFAEDGISFSNFNGKTWSYPFPIHIPELKNASPYAEYQVSASQNFIVMSIENAESYGDRDLYVSIKNDQGLWSKALHLGDINTSHTELSPFLAADDKTLYFSSLGHPGFGGADVYMCRRLDDTWQKWSDVVNLGPTINSQFWDISFSCDAEGSRGFFSRSANKNADIFEISMPYKAKPDPIIVLNGIVKDKSNGKPISVDIESTQGLQSASQKSHALSGRFKFFYLKNSNQAINLSINQLGYLKFTEDFKPSDLANEIVIELTPIKKGEKLVIDNLHFELGTATLLAESYNALYQLKELFDIYPSLKIRLEGHTDIVGEADKNLQLSKERVEFLKDYLVKSGVSQERIDLAYFGESKPIVMGENHIVRYKNRRVEIIILDL